MSEFRKYNSIENTYRTKNIMKFIDKFPGLEKAEYIAYEKLDGANIQLLFQPNEKLKVGKRTSFLEEGESFFDIWNTLAKYEKELSSIQTYSNESGKTIRLFGELYGPGINGRVDYGPDKKIALFDASINEELLTQIDLSMFLQQREVAHLLPPFVGNFFDLAGALDIDVEQNSLVLNKTNNPMEGVVIHPFKQNFIYGHDRLILKKKGEGFKEVEGAKNPKPKNEVAGHVMEAHAKFKGYINESRMLSTFTKHGVISDPKQIGDYIRLILEDAKEDFYKDNDDIVLDDKEAKIVFNVGKTIVRMLNAHL